MAQAAQLGTDCHEGWRAVSVTDRQAPASPHPALEFHKRLRCNGAHQSHAPGDRNDHIYASNRLLAPVQQAQAELRAATVWGFDTEFKPTFIMDRVSDGHTAWVKFRNAHQPHHLWQSMLLRFNRFRLRLNPIKPIHSCRTI